MSYSPEYQKVVEELKNRVERQGVSSTSMGDLALMAIALGHELPPPQEYRTLSELASKVQL